MGIAAKKIGQQTYFFQRPPVILSTATIVGPKEGQGPLGHTFDKVVEDPYYGEKSWEKAEQRMLEEAMQKALQKANLAPQNVDLLLAGDLFRHGFPPVDSGFLESENRFRPSPRGFSAQLHHTAYSGHRHRPSALLGFIHGGLS